MKKQNEEKNEKNNLKKIRTFEIGKNHMLFLKKLKIGKCKNAKLRKCEIAKITNCDNAKIR